MADKQPKSSGEVVLESSRTSVDEWRASQGLPRIDWKKPKEDKPKG